MLFVLPGIKEAAYLMYPFFTDVTLHPAFFMNLIVLLLLQVTLLNGKVDELEWCVFIKIIIALIAPEILVISTNVVISISRYSFALAVQPVAEENRRFKKSFLAAT